MSFNAEVKKELCAVESNKSCCVHAECYGMALFCRWFSLREMVFKTEYEEIARRFRRLLQQCCGVTARLQTPARAGGLYSVIVDSLPERRAVLDAFGYTGTEPFLRLNRGNFEEDDCVAAFLRGDFLTCGSITDPNSDYHLEFAVSRRHIANDLVTLLSEYRTRPNLTTRKADGVVYYKGCGKIEDLLTMMQATRCALRLIDVEMMKELRNRVNRATNCETANLSKSLEAGQKQLQAISLIQKTVGLSALPPELHEIALLRRDNPEASLSELGQMLTEPMSRSGANHRLHKVVEFAEKIEKQKHKETT